MRDYVNLIVEAFDRDFPELVGDQHLHWDRCGWVSEYWDVHYHPVTQEVFINVECEYLRIPEGHKDEFVEKARLIIRDYYNDIFGKLGNQIERMKESLYGISCVPDSCSIPWYVVNSSRGTHWKSGKCYLPYETGANKVTTTEVPYFNTICGLPFETNEKNKVRVESSTGGRFCEENYEA